MHTTPHTPLTLIALTTVITFTGCRTPETVELVGRPPTDDAIMAGPPPTDAGAATPKAVDPQDDFDWIAECYERTSRARFPSQQTSPITALITVRSARSDSPLDVSAAPKELIDTAAMSKCLGIALIDEGHRTLGEQWLAGVALRLTPTGEADKVEAKPHRRTSGGLSTADLDRQLDIAFPKLERCFIRAQKAIPNVDGAIYFEVAVNEDQHTKLALYHSSITSSDFDSCARSVLGSMKLPPVEEKKPRGSDLIIFATY